MGLALVEVALGSSTTYLKQGLKATNFLRFAGTTLEQNEQILLRGSLRFNCFELPSKNLGSEFISNTYVGSQKCQFCLHLAMWTLISW